MKSTILSLFVFLTLSSLIFGQSKNTKGSSSLKSNELDEIYTPPKNSLFDELSSKNQSISNYNFKNCIKLNPLYFFRNTFALGYERIINDHVGVEGFLGYSYGSDAIQKLGIVVSEEMKEDATPNTDVYLGEISEYGKFKKGGLFGSIGLKYYYDGNAFDDYFIGIQSRFNSFTRTVNLDNYGNGYQDIDVKVNNMSTYFIWGNSRVSGSSKRPFVQEFYTGIGIRNSSFDAIDRIENVDANGYTSYYHQLTGEKAKTIGFVFVMSYTIGFGL